MARILVVANKTAESPDLLEALKEKGTEHEYVLVVPASGGQPKRLTRNKVWDVDPDWR